MRSLNIHIICTMLLMLLALGQGTAMAETNLLHNGDFTEGLLHWKFESDSGAAAMPQAEGGPGGGPFIRLKSLGGSVSFSQLHCTLPKGETFRIECQFRMEGALEPGDAQVVILCLPDKNYFKLEGEPGKWNKFELDFTSTYGVNYISFQLKKGPATLDIANAKIIPLSPQTNSKRALTNLEQALVPLANLHYIPKDTQNIRFQWSGKMPLAEDKLVAVFHTKENPQRVVKVTLNGRFASLDLRELGDVKEGILNAELQDKDGKRSFFKAEYPFRILELPKASGVKRLNNLVTELYNGRISGQTAVPNPRYGWLYLKYEPDTAGESFAVNMNGQPVITEKSLRHETVRLMEPGEVSFDTTGNSGRLLVRAIPDILMFPIGLNDWGGNGRYNWRFAKRFMFPALTTVDGGIPVQANIAEMRAMGLRWFNNCLIKNKKQEEILADLEASKSLHGTQYDGVSFDELTLSEPGNIDRFAWAFRRFGNPDKRVLNVWITGTPIPSNANAFSAVMNASEGHGRLMQEFYKHTQRTEDEAKLYLENVRQNAIVARQVMDDGYRQNYSAILGCFNESPSISLNVYPHVDFKYFLEMLVRMLALEKEFDGLSGVGYWGVHHANEEGVRWAFALLRHYAIEGRTDWLSSKYGFKYIPGLLANPDFEDGLAKWQANELVRADRLPGYGKGIQNRYGAPKGTGDNVAVFSRTADAYGELKQTMTGLVPGKAYFISFITADYNDVKNNAFNPRRQPIEYSLDNCEILRNTRIIARNTPSSDEKANKVRVNSTKLVFRAKAPTATLSFDNKKAQAGEETVLNYICVTPYFEREGTL